MGIDLSRFKVIHGGMVLNAIDGSRHEKERV